MAKSETVTIETADEKSALELLAARVDTLEKRNAELEARLEDNSGAVLSEDEIEHLRHVLNKWHANDLPARN